MPTYMTPEGSTDTLTGKILNEPSHTLIAGTTGSGKSVFLRSIIRSALFRFPFDAPGGAAMVLIDLKRVELSDFRHLPHTLLFADEIGDAVEALRRVSATMENRYKAMQTDGLKLYQGGDLYVIIDELADLIRSDVRRILPQLEHIGRLGRAAKVHLILCTQSPDRKTLCATVQQNATLTFALRCRSAIESRQIIGVNGAEALPRYGQTIYRDAEGLHTSPVPFYPDEDILRLVEDWEWQAGRQKPLEKRKKAYSASF